MDPKTIERWISTTGCPTGPTVRRCASRSAGDEEFLWPAAVSEARAESASQAEFVAIHANRGSVPAGNWRSLLEGAEESIDASAFAAELLHDTIPDFDDLLVRKAREGVRVRTAWDLQSGRSHPRRRGGQASLPADALTWKYLRPCLRFKGIEARAHDTTLHSSIFRFDEDLFANTHAYGAPSITRPCSTCTVYLRRPALPALHGCFSSAFGETAAS